MLAGLPALVRVFPEISYTGSSSRSSIKTFRPLNIEACCTELMRADVLMHDFRSTLHFSSGFPMVIGLHHVEDYKKIKVSDPSEHMIFTRPGGDKIRGSGVTHGYHHYIITTRPRCMLRPGSFHWNPTLKKAVGELEFEVGYGKYKRVPFELFLDGKTSPYPLILQPQIASPNAIVDVCVVPGPMGHPNRVLVKGTNGAVVLYLEPDLLHFIRVDDRDWPCCLDFKIEYIGISTGKKDNLDFGDRLWNHEKVREIAGIIQRDAPNLQVYVFGYKVRYIIEVAPQRFIENSSILESKLKPRERAEVFEAALISHFQPTYNKEFKFFPTKERPAWLKQIKDILRPSHEPEGKALLSAVLASDNRYNSEGAWTFGRFYTDHTNMRDGPTDLCAITIDISAAV